MREQKCYIVLFKYIRVYFFEIYLRHVCCLSQLIELFHESLPNNLGVGPEPPYA